MPGLNRRGPRGDGPLTGGRRGLCGDADYYSPLSQVYGTGRGGRPWGGGRGRAWGGGRGQADPPALRAGQLDRAYPAPHAPAAGWLDALERLLEGMGQLGAVVTELRARRSGESTGTAKGDHIDDASE